MMHPLEILLFEQWQYIVCQDSLIYLIFFHLFIVTPAITFLTNSPSGLLLGASDCITVHRVRLNENIPTHTLLSISQI